MRRSWVGEGQALLATAAAGGVLWASGAPRQTPPSQPMPAERVERFRTMSAAAEERGLAEPFKGITTNGTVEPGLFRIASTGVSTEPVRQAAAAFLSGLTPEQGQRTRFSVDDPEWRKWMNQHFYVRQGLAFRDMTDAQRHAAFGLLRASLSAKGLTLTRDIMKLNTTRIHSPVVLIEFDHQLPVGTRHLAKDPKAPMREHVHVVIRTPNGNDYGKDLLRQHHAAHRHDASHGHAR